MAAHTHTANGPTKADKLADAINRLLYNLVIRCSKDDGIRDYFYVSIIGYNGNRVGSGFNGILSERNLVPISDIGNNPLRVDQRNRKEDDGAGGVIERTVKFPIWFEPLASGGTPMRQALALAKEQVSNWLIEHTDCFPPVIIHITDGESTDGDPADIMNDIKNLSSTDGNVLLFNCHFTANRSAQPIAFPGSPVNLVDQYARGLFEGSSLFTPGMLEIARNEHKIALEENARGYVLNADITLVVLLLDIGTRGPEVTDPNR